MLYPTHDHGVVQYSTVQVLIETRGQTEETSFSRYSSGTVYILKHVTVSTGTPTTHTHSAISLFLGTHAASPPTEGPNTVPVLGTVVT